MAAAYGSVLKYSPNDLIATIKSRIYNRYFGSVEQSENICELLKTKKIAKPSQELRPSAVFLLF